ncbi:3-deoxy-D-manno-octulosonic acid transferase [candidate division FCPU426 bacterium]|nr:3-deoxy-D-manno-octulosonic acid transferase [candidate division FCPU426 bacterium]
MHVMYNFSIRLLTLLLLPVLLPLILLFSKSRTGLCSRLGFYSRRMRERLQEMPRPRIWIHAASMGEISAICPVARALKERNPSMGIIITTMTLTGLKQAKQKMDFASAILFLPLDYPGAVKRALRAIEPNLLIVAETELWPNLIRQAKKRGAQVALINGRISERSFKRYRMVRPLLKALLQRFDLLAVQSFQDSERFQNLGANPQRLKIVGNVKFDAVAGAETRRLQEDLRLDPGHPVWVAGSTRPGEEEIIIQAFQRVQEQVPQEVLVLAVRHLERLPEVERLLTQQRIAFTYRSRVNRELVNFPVILLDTMGELADLYGVGRVAFVGGSLTPFGGHNPLEPSLLGVPVVVGPHTQHFAEVTQILVNQGGAKVVTNAEELAEAITYFFLHPEEAQNWGGRARKAVLAYQGVASQTVEMVQKLMLIKRWAGEVKKWRQESQQNSAFATQPEPQKEDWPEW